MARLELRRMHNRYRLTRARLGELRRLDQIGRSLADGVLEQALWTSRLELAGELCIRSLEVPVRVRLSAGDAEIAAAWSRAITSAIGAALESRDPGVVAFASRRHALLDMAAGVARADLARAWAWAELGIWEAPAGAGDATAIEELVRSLAVTATDTVPVLAGLARLGLLPRLAARLSRPQLERLASAAGAAAGLEVAGIAPGVGSADLAILGGSSAAAESPWQRLAKALAGRSEIFGALAGSGGVLGNGEARHWLALLAALEADPGTVARGGAMTARLVGAIAAQLAGAAGSGEPNTVPGPESAQRAAAPVSDAGGAAAPNAAASDPRIDPDIDPRTDPAAAALATEAAPPAGVRGEPAGADEEAAALPPDPRRRALTAAGGLLFLVHLVDRLDLPARLGAAPELEGRPLRWTLHRLAIRLAGLAEEDPAALAFCGLGPDARPPSKDGPPPSETELGVLEAAATELAQALADALERRLEAPAEVLAEVSARRAEIVGEPGWIDVLLAADDVSTEVRRAGLDLDPGWVPWLGVVLRFIYG